MAKNRWSTFYSVCLFFCIRCHGRNLEVHALTNLRAWDLVLDRTRSLIVPETVRLEPRFSLHKQTHVALSVGSRNVGRKTFCGLLKRTNVGPLPWRVLVCNVKKYPTTSFVQAVSHNTINLYFVNKTYQQRPRRHPSVWTYISHMKVLVTNPT